MELDNKAAHPAVHMFATLFYVAEPELVTRERESVSCRQHASEAAAQSIFQLLTKIIVLQTMT